VDSGHQVQERAAWAGSEPGAEVRRARRAGGLTLAQLGARTGYSAAQVSRFERGLAPLNDIAVLWLFADALAIPPEVFGLTPRPPGHRQPPRRIAPSSGPALSLAPTVACEAERESGEDAVRRRQLLANLTVTAAAAASTPLLGSGTAQVPERSSGLLLTERVRDTMLGLSPVAATIPAGQLRSGLASAMTDFHACRYARLARALPSLIASGHAAAAQAPDDPAVNAALAQIYTLVTRMLIKLDDPQLGWMAADRARVIAGAAADPLITAEAARNLAVLARKAGWHDQATSIALSAADDPGLRGADRHRLAERGLLIQSAAYTAARHGDRSRARELTDEAAAIAARLRGATLLRDHGGGFSPATVELHRISAEHYVGEPGAALAAARRISPASLPSIERRARYYTDVARASGQAGRRDDCLNALLAAEREAPEEIHARPAIRDLITGLLLSGRTTRELRGLAARCRVV
jgi:transcriptional regulator with XRE-family HTH domain